MRPRLITEQGEFVLDPEGVTIGRDASNRVRIEDRMASGFHCRVECVDQRFVIADCGSKNGTYVNSNPVERTFLEHGDEIRVGHTKLRFLVRDVSAPEIHFGESVEGSVLTSETVLLDPSNSMYFKAEPLQKGTSLRRLARDMNVLLALSAEVNQQDDSDRLQRLILERTFEIIPAENGSILMASASGKTLLPSGASLQRVPGGREIIISKTITETTLTSGQSVLRNDLTAGGAPADSLAASSIQSVLCVPLSVLNARIGVLYLYTTNAETPFDQRHLELATAIAAIGAVGIEHLRYVEWLEAENHQLAAEVTLRHEMVGQSEKMRKVYEDIARLAPNDNRVLILGESGTGKELAARAIYKNSNRRHNPFIAVNCGGISETLFMSELFGHTKGAFTGADRDRKGFLEEAHDGTLFLDEIGDLPPACQAALLRTLESGELFRVGSSRRIQVNVRFIFATNHSLKDRAADGRFRNDLYFRLGLPLRLPPLRERLEDIPLLVRFFLQNLQHLTERSLGPTPPDTIRVLQEYQWPGNVRELELAIRWAVVFGKSERIRPEDLPPEIVNRANVPSASAGRLDDAKQSYERQLILRALEETRGVVSEAAIMLDRVPTYLQRRISQLGLREELKGIRQNRPWRGHSPELS